MSTVNRKLTRFLMVFAVSTQGVAALASDVDLADVPLAVKTEGAAPNIMFLIDDSGSMGAQHGGDDVFYAPGYDSDLDYECSSGSTVLESVAGQTLTTFVSATSGTSGTPYFSYNGNYYAWGNGSSASVSLPDPDATVTATSGSTQYINKDTGQMTVNRVCFNPDAEYTVLLKADSPVSFTERAQTGTNAIGQCDSGYTKNDGYCYKNSDRYNPGWSACNTGYVKFSSRCWLTSSREDFPMSYIYEPVYTTYGTYTFLSPSSTVTKVFKGEFLNWYFSATAAEFADNTISGGYVSYSGSHWSQTPATNFVVSTTDTDLKGMKPDVHFTHERIDVAVDVAKMLVRKMDGVNMSLASFHTQGDGDKSSSHNGYLMHGFVPLKSDVSSSETNANKVSLIETIDVLEADGDTPTSESMVRMARYFFNGWEDLNFDYYDGPTRSPVTKKVSGVLGLAQDATGAVEYDADKRILNQDDWCQKSAMAVLTDGEPTNDDGYHVIPSGAGRAASNNRPDAENKKGGGGWGGGGGGWGGGGGGGGGGGSTDTGACPGYGPLYCYDALGTTQETAFGTDKAGIMRVPGALYDLDWVVDMRGTQNIESFFIAFGDESTVNAPIFDEAGKAGGGGVNNSFAATDGSAVIDAFKKIVESVLAASTSITAVAVSSVAELQTENYAFQATYDTKFWTSQIKALNVNEQGLFVQPDGTGGQRTSEGITPEWEASKVLASQYILNDDDIDGDDVSGDYRSNGVKGRRVFTWSGTEGQAFGSSTMARPTSSASLSEFNALPASIKADLAVVAGTDGREQYDLMMFLMGDVRNELGYPSTTATNKYRQRGSYSDADSDGLIDAVNAGGILGDIVDSSPVYVQQPSRNWDDINYGTSSKRFSHFKALQASRPAMVYAGANDGFLHAFTVEQNTIGSVNYPKGAEVFAYMPSLLASTEDDRGFHYLSDRFYTHRFYVDLTSTPSDVFMDFYSSGVSGDPIDSEWRTVLVGGLRKGGRGYFALDVTCPFEDDTGHVQEDGTPLYNTCADESFSADNVLWEFGTDDDGDLGYSFSEPIVAKVNYDSGFNYSTSSGTERNGNGNGRWAVIIGNGYNSDDGRAALYILFLDGGLDGTWTEGVDYLKIYVSDATADTASNKNGLSSPTAVDINYDGVVDRIYAGDLKGQLWSFDVSGQADNDDYDNASMPWTANKLFTAGKDSSTRQAIITAPGVARDTSRGRVLPASNPDLMVVFGTGRYLGETDLDDLSVQTIYGVHDRGTFNLTRYGTVTVSGEEYPMLAPRIFKETTIETLRNRTVEGDKMLSAQFGWYVDLASDLDDDGEVSGDEELLGERLAFRPFIAGNLFVFNTIIPIVGSCSGATQGWTLALDWTSGSAYKQETYDANSNGVIDPLDQGYVGMFNEAAGSELGRGGNNIFDSVGDIARSQSFNFGSNSISERIGWEEKLPFGVKAE